MSTDNIIRAWKDPKYSGTLSPEERTMVPEHPAGIVELSDAELGDVSGGANHWDSIFGNSFGFRFAFDGILSNCEFFPKTKGPKCPDKKAK